MMEVVFRLGSATAAEVRDGLADPPSYSSVRATLAILEDKGHLRHESRGNRYVFFPTVSQGTARRSALRSLLETFFGGSPKEAVVALLGDSGEKLTRADLDEIERLIADARRKGR